jgi:hypothetical protein
MAHRLEQLCLDRERLAALHDRSSQARLTTASGAPKTRQG